MDQAEELLERSVVNYQGRPVGTLAAVDPDSPPLNYSQCFMRDFVPSALYFLMRARPEIVRNFLDATLELQAQERLEDANMAAPGLMPASFKVVPDGDGERLVGDFGEDAIGRVAPVDSCLWWVLLLAFYGRVTGDWDLAHQDRYQTGLRYILELYLEERFEMFPTVLTPDGSFMIDRRMGVAGHPLEIQALFCAALKAAPALIAPGSACERYRGALERKLELLLGYIHECYWLDLPQLNRIYRFRSEQYGACVANRFNVQPGAVPSWVSEWLPREGGYLVGNVGPGHVDFRFFAQGNFLAVLSGLIGETERAGLMQLVEQRWDDLVGSMPCKICYPALEGQAWHIVTGADQKNLPWSYHNGGNWPVLLWSMTAACLESGRRDLAERAVEVAERRLVQDRWPEYYDGPTGRLIGREARLHQTWSIAGYLLARELLDRPQDLKWFNAL